MLQEVERKRIGRDCYSGDNMTWHACRVLDNVGRMKSGRRGTRRRDFRSRSRHIMLTQDHTTGNMTRKYDRRTPAEGFCYFCVDDDHEP